MSRQDWVVEALRTLAREGVHGVKIDRLARRLGVTKGSFYWHFGNRDDLLQAALDYWDQDLTVQVRNRAQAFGGHPEQRLVFLSRIIEEKGAGEFDYAVRIWAMTDENVARVVRKVDQTRVTYLKQIFHELGFQDAESEMRARVYLHYEAVESSIFLPQKKAERDELRRLRVKMLTSKPGDGVEG